MCGEASMVAVVDGISALMVMGPVRHIITLRVQIIYYIYTSLFLAPGIRSYCTVETVD